MTELAVFRVTEEGLVLEELQEGVDLQTVKEKTEATFRISSANVNTSLINSRGIKSKNSKHR